MAEERLGASFTIDVTQLKAGLKTANKLIRESQSEFKAAAAGLDNWQKSEQGLNAKIKSLNQIIPVQEQKVRALKEQYRNLINSGLDPTSDRAVELRTKINQEEAALESNRAELRRQTEALEELENASEEAGDEIEEVGNKAEKSSKGFTVLKGALANLVADGFRAAISAMKDFAKESATVGMTFDSSMSQVGAVSGATGDDLERLRDKAKEMGSTTKFTASEAADAFNYMAMAGWKTEDMISGIDGILNLAAASGADLATTSDIVTDALTAMGYGAGDAGRLADVMAAASSNANTNVEMMGQTFKYAAPIVGALGYSMEDTAVAIGLMANAGIKGEMAGTALRSVLTRLSAPPSECAKAMDALGLSITDSNGKMKSLDTIINELRKAFDGMGEAEQTAYAKNIAGQEAMSGLLAIVNAAPEDFQKLTKAVENSSGAAEKMATTMLDNLGGDMTVLKSQVEGVQLTLYEKFEPTLRSVIKKTQKYLGSVNWSKFGDKAVKAFKNIIDYGKRFAKNVLPTIKKALEVVGKVVKFVIDNFQTLSKVVLIAVTAFKAFKAAMAVTTAITAAKTAVAALSAGVGIATKAQVGWNAAMTANPIGAVITAVALLTAGIVLLAKKQNEVAESTDVLSESQRGVVDSAAAAAESFRDNKKAADEMAAANAANVDYVRYNLLPELQNIVDANGKVKEGEEARAQFILNELNQALGTEYQSLSDIVDANGKIKDSIYEVMNAKKAQFYLEAYEETYREAIQNSAEAEKARATQAQAVARAQDQVSAALRGVEEAEEALDEATFNGGITAQESAARKVLAAEKAVQAAQEALEKEKTAYNEASAVVQDYYNTIDSYDNASTAVLEGNTQRAIDILSRYGGGFQTAASTAKMSADEQRATLEQQVIDTEVNLKLMEADYAKYSGGMTDEEKAQAQKRLENARRQANEAKEEFKKVGGNITKGMAQGAEGEEWQLTASMRSVINKAVSAAKKAAGIKSPSRLFRKAVGRMIGRGTALGIIDSTKDVVGAVRKQVDDIQSAYGLDGFATSVNAGVTGGTAQGGNGTQSKSVVVNQYNTYSQAHSRYEIYRSKQQTAAAVRLALGTV